MKIKHLGMTYVKCTRFRDVLRADIASFGMVGDREFVLVSENKELLGARQHAPFLPLEFEYSSAEGLLTLRYPDGRSISDVLRYADHCETLNYLEMRNIKLRKVLGIWESLLSDFSGLNVMLYQSVGRGAGIDVKPLTLFTTGSLRKLSELMNCEIDHRRFRANLVLENDEPHVEDQWDGSILQVGTARLRVRSSVPRCVVTQFDPRSGRDDLNVVHALQSYRDRVKMPDGLMPHYATPGFASYVEVLSPGVVCVGDKVSLHRNSSD